jgi:hypothetical protein
MRTYQAEFSLVAAFVQRGEIFGESVEKLVWNMQPITLETDYAPLAR